jgi:MFS family permease
MTTPWFDPNAWAWLPGTLFGCLAGLWGSLAGTLAPQGKARGLVVGTGWALIVVSLGFLVTAVVAYFVGQPYGIWYGLGLPGVLGVILFPSIFPIVLLRYRQAEERRMMAQDLRA